MEREEGARVHLLVMRHSVAEEHCASGLDADRPLTEEGRARARRVGDGLWRLGFRVDRVLSSPFTRARETAEVVAASLGVSAITYVPALEPGGSVEGALRAADASLAGVGRPEGVLLVSHQPLVGTLVERLIGGGCAHVRMEPGALVALEVRSLFPRLPGELVLLAPPQLWER